MLPSTMMKTKRLSIDKEYSVRYPEKNSTAYCQLVLLVTGWANNPMPTPNIVASAT